RPYRVGDVMRRSACGTYDSSSVGALTATGFFYADAPRATLAVGKPGFPAPRQPRLLDRVREVLRARHSSRRTEKSCVACIRRYIVFHGKRHPAEMGAVEVMQFLSSPAGPGLVRPALVSPNPKITQVASR